MIKLKIGNGAHETDIRFPISEINLYNRLFAILTIDSAGKLQPVTVTGIYWPEEFSVLEGRQVNLDEMNYLARRMESFDDREMDQFLIGVSTLNEPSLKNLINLTFNLDHFTLVQDIIQTDNGGEFTHAQKTNRIHPLDVLCGRLHIQHKTIRPRTPWHNGKVERSHRSDQERFYNHLSFYSYENLKTQMKRYLRRSNRIPMSVLGWKTPIQKRQELEAARIC